MAETGGRTEVVATICGSCHNNCGMLVHVRDGVITEIKGNPDHPMNHGALCVKGRAMRELVYAPDRLRRPLRRAGERGEGKWQEISWDDALGEIADRLLAIRNESGPEALMFATGAPVMEFQRYAFTELLARYGTPNKFASNLCSGPLTAALETVYGYKSQPDYEGTRLILMWGGNPWASMRPGHNIAYGKGALLKPVLDARRAGARLVVIDPAYTETAEHADWWLAPRPGTDGALALAMLNVVIEEGLYDRAFVEAWTTGFDELRVHVRTCTPEWAATITGLPADEIRRLAVMYGETRPATIRWGNGFANHTNVGQALRAGGCLQAICGNLDVPGGDLRYPTELRYKTTVKPVASQLGAERYPLLPAGPSILDAMLTGKPYQPRAMLAMHTNLLSNAGYPRVQEAVRRLDLVVVMDIFLTRTCSDLADIVLPDTTFLERYDWRSYPCKQGLWVSLRQPVVPPLHESRPVYDVEYDLAGRMGLAEGYPWHDAGSMAAYHLKYVGLDVDRLRAAPAVLTGGNEYRKHEKGLMRSDGQPGFATPSGKVELFSGRLQALGYEPVPTYHEPAESPVSTPDLARRYPLVGVNRRPLAYVHYKYRNLPSLRKIEPEPSVYLAEVDAGVRGLADGEWAAVRSPRGRIRMKARVRAQARPGVAWIDGGWGNPWDHEDANINDLTDSAALDPMVQCPSISSFQCEVEAE